ncbi:T9SS type A sorting domain-containing protein [candidate division KSB1 bacterium]
MDLGWSPNNEADLYYYKIYRNISGSKKSPAVVYRLYNGENSIRIHGLDRNTTYDFRVAAVDSAQNEGPFAGPVSALPVVYSLSQNYPNPFNISTVIEFGLSETLPVILKIYDLNGRLVRTLIDRSFPPGHYRLNWDGTDNSGKRLGSGVYFYQIKAGKLHDTRKMVMLK